ncbi:hypothetical protein CHS0354_012375 [Potamilus streckersoni]|uniref:Sugar phosphate transporter domain-containing protein n=1 Tax=Potamilus streckersoni TaxID=2493646 RepID=A0AAE0VY53_9BIVA|nr:hypothetical protein CHS0354_012375 [Potamilus streckersoni]
MTHYSSSQRTAYGIIAGVIALYWMVSISLVFLNKHILSGAFGHNDLTIFSSWYQSMCAVGFILFLRAMSKQTNLRFSVPTVDFSHLLSSDMLMLSFSFVLSLVFNNLMLKHINVAFYQVARSVTIIFTILMSACMLRKKISCQAGIACLIIIAGFVLGIDQEDVSGTLSVFGIIYGVLASFLAAVCGIYFKKVEILLEGESLKLAYFNNLNSVLIFLPLVFSSGQVQSVFSSDIAFQPKFWLLLTFTGILSLSIGWVSAMQIKYTSPVTHHISINAKSVTQTLIAVLIYQESKTFLWWLGNGLVIIGLLFYVYTQIQEEKSNQSKETLLMTDNNGYIKGSNTA